MNFTKHGLLANGFQGFIRIKDYTDSPGLLELVPKLAGVYVVYCTTPPKSALVEESFHHAEQSTNHAALATEVLPEQWTEQAGVVYIGTTSGAEGESESESESESGQEQATLHAKLQELITLGQGIPVNQFSSNRMWQLGNVEEFKLAYKPLPNDNPDRVRAELLHGFREQYGRLPFANV